MREKVDDRNAALDPAGALRLLGNETRLRILQTLAGATDTPLSFVELQERVGLKDSGRFNYHLQKLVGPFVRTADEGYDLLFAGRLVNAAVVSGSFNERPVLGPLAIDGRCVDCAGPLRARYGDERMVIECSSCSQVFGRHPFPPAGIYARTEATLLEDFNQYVRHRYCTMIDGVCPDCGGVTSASIVHEPDAPLAGTVFIAARCERCHVSLKTHLGFELLYEPEVIAFYHERGSSLHWTPFWTLDWCTSDRHMEVRSRDPWRCTFTVPLAGDEIVVELTDELR